MRKQPENTPPELRATADKIALLDIGRPTKNYSAIVCRPNGSLSLAKVKGAKPPYVVEVGFFYIESFIRERDLLRKVWRFTSLEFSHSKGLWMVQADWLLKHKFTRKGWEPQRIDPGLEMAASIADGPIWPPR